MKLSIIIPVYNCVAYVEECVKSIYNCSIPEIELEMLLVDDGSTDGSGALLDVLAEKYAKVMRVFHTPNQGVSVARNIALEHATGEWLMFVDADDILQPDTLQCLYYEAQFYRYDVTRFGACLFGGGRKMRKWHICSRFSHDLGKFRELTISRVAMVTIWGGIYRKSLIDDFHIRFIPGMRFGEDGLVLNMTLCRAKTFKYVDKALYAYREADGSVCRTERDYIPTDSHKTIALTLNYARECGVEVSAHAVEVMKALYCRGAMRFALKHRTKAAFTEAEQVMNTYCRLPLWRIVRHALNIQQALGPIAYYIVRPLYI